MADPDIARITTWGAVEASNGIRTIAGTTDVDVTAADYTAGAALLTIEPVAGYPIRNVDIYLDLAKDTTGLIVVNTTETIGFVVQQKIDGANWQGVDAWPKAGESGILVPDAAGDLDADAWQGVHWHFDSIHPNADLRILLVLDAETGGDAEVPYRITYEGPVAPVVTAVAAG